MTEATTSTKREELRAEMEQARVGYHELLASLSDEDMKKKSGNATWTNGQLMWHLSWGVGFIPGMVERSRNGKDLKLPRGLFNLLNPWMTRWGARGAKREKLGPKYDDAHAKALAALETVKDDEWSRTATITGDALSVEHHFRMPAVHFAEHRADILQSLGRES